MLCKPVKATGYLAFQVDAQTTAGAAVAVDSWPRKLGLQGVDALPFVLHCFVLSFCGLSLLVPELLSLYDDGAAGQQVVELAAAAAFGGHLCLQAPG